MNSLQHGTRECWYCQTVNVKLTHKSLSQQLEWCCSVPNIDDSHGWYVIPEMVSAAMPIDIDLNGTNGNGNSASGLQNRGTSTTAGVTGEVNAILMAYYITSALVFLILSYFFGGKTVLLCKQDHFCSSKCNCDGTKARTKSGSPATKAKKVLMQLFFFVAFSQILICINMCTKNAFSGTSLVVISIAINFKKDIISIISRCILSFERICNIK